MYISNELIISDELFIKMNRVFNRFQRYVIYKIAGNKYMCDLLLDIMTNKERERVFYFELKEQLNK